MDIDVEITCWFCKQTVRLQATGGFLMGDYWVWDHVACPNCGKTFTLKVRNGKS